jgi:hypothetical protein
MQEWSSVFAEPFTLYGGWGLQAQPRCGEAFHGPCQGADIDQLLLRSPSACLGASLLNCVKIIV